MRMRCVSLLSLLSIALAGCGASQVNPEDHSNSTLPAPNEIDPVTSPVAGTPKQWDDMPIDPALPIPTNPGLEALIEKTKADLAQRLSIQVSEIKSIESKEVVWPDTSLGCPQPGMAYAQMLTPGYLVKLAYSGNEFEYHVDIHGNVVHCENPTPPVVGTPLE